MKQHAQLFKSLADETRLRLIALLLRYDELCVCDLMAAMNLPQSTVSRHLATLRNSGLVSDRRQGVWMYYRLAKQTGIIQHSGLLDSLAVICQQTSRARTDLARLKKYLAEKKTDTCV